jgi:hypothetical protein
MHEMLDREQVRLMKLYYRGVSYNLTPPVKIPPGKISGTYRGQFWQFQQGDLSGQLGECDRCQFYSGNPHLLCAVHPQGPPAKSCPDFRLNLQTKPVNQPDLKIHKLSNF